MISTCYRNGSLRQRRRCRSWQDQAAVKRAVCKFHNPVGEFSKVVKIVARLTGRKLRPFERRSYSMRLRGRRRWYSSAGVVRRWLNLQDTGLAVIAVPETMEGSEWGRPQNSEVVGCRIGTPRSSEREDGSRGVDAVVVVEVERSSRFKSMSSLGYLLSKTDRGTERKRDSQQPARHRSMRALEGPCAACSTTRSINYT